MSTIPRRHRSSTAASYPLEISEATADLQILLQSLSYTLRTRSNAGYPDILKLIGQLQGICRHLISSSQPDQAKDDFRHLHGFQVLLDAVRAFSGYYHPSKRTQKDKEQIFSLLENIFGVFLQTFREHHGNRRYFKQRVEGGGWTALEQAIASIGVGGSESDRWSEAQLFGRLLTFAMDDKRFEAICQKVADPQLLAFAVEGERRDSLPEGITKLQIKEKSSKANDKSDKSDTPQVETSNQVKTDAEKEDEKFLGVVDNELQDTLREGTLLFNADAVPTIIDFWKTIPRNPKMPVNPAALVVILTFSKLASILNHNLLALHSTGILSTLLPLAFDFDSPLGVTERRLVEVLCESLISLGISTLDDAQYLIRSKSPTASEFLLRAVKKSDTPAYIQFDLSLKGYASIELPTLGRSFPPTTSSSGYTFTAWICVDEFDPSSHTTIFGAYDASHTCFVLAYLEKDSHNFILQTSVTSSRPSIRFKSTVFKERRWYHIALVHQKHKLSSSKAILYVDGEFVERLKCQYPSSPALSGGTEGFTSFTPSSAKPNPVQSFLGTPKDLSARLGPGIISSRWSLASAHLFEEVLNDDLVAVYYRLGPRYNGNFQDSLGSFQTYEASAALNVRNELSHPGKDQRSDILVAIRQKASALVPESRILLSVLPTAVLGNDDRRESHELQLFRGLNRAASNSLFQLTRNNGTSIVINSAIPSINEALIHPEGTIMQIGEPAVITPQSLDDALWRLGGFTAVALRLVESEASQDGIARALQIVFDCIKGSWRNSEAMERENGYTILGAILRGKLGAGTVISSKDNSFEVDSMTNGDREKLSFQLLSLVLQFVGYCHEKPEDSFIINPLAYRTLLVDFDMWRKTAPITQKLYYKQFIVFGVDSKHHQFNSERLFRMRIVKRFLDALKAETFSRDVLPSFMEALISLVKCNMSAEVFRSLALFVTYSYHIPTSSFSRTPRLGSGTLPSRSSTISTGPKRPALSTLFDGADIISAHLSKRQLGTKVLEMYADLLCEKENTSRIRKFARTVTNRWLLHLLTEDDAEVVVLGSKILARLLVVHGSAYISKFVSKSGGFIIMRHRLKRWWDIPTLWPICFSILFAHDVADIDFERPFELFSLLETFGNSKVVYPDFLPVIMTMLQNGLKEVIIHQDDPDSPLSDRSSGSVQESSLNVPTGSRRRSMSLTKELESRLVVSADAVSAETELNSRNSALTFEGDDVMIKPISQSSASLTPIVRTSTVETHLPPSPTAPRATPLRRGSSFILLTSRPSPFSPSSARLNLPMSPKKKVTTQKASNALIEGLLELVINILIDQVTSRKDFHGFGLFLKVPPGFQEHQAYFESYLLRNTISQLSNNLKLDQNSVWEPKLILNLSRFVHHIGEAVYEGWFLSGAEPLMDFAGTLLEYLQRPEIAQVKSVRLCSQAILTIKSVFLRVVLLRLSELDNPQLSEDEALAFMNRLLYWQTIVLSSDITADDFLKLICYQLYTRLVDSRENIRLAAANLWRILLVQKPEETSTILNEAMSNEQNSLTYGFKGLVEVDNETFVAWVDDNRTKLDGLFFGAMSRSWDEFVNAENQKTEDTAKNRVAKRRERLGQWRDDDALDQDIFFRHQLASDLWMKNIYASEHLKHQRSQQDQQDSFSFLVSTFSKMDRELHRPCAVFDNASPTKWKLDRTEGRNRMRLRMLPDQAAPAYDYQPKRRATDTALNGAPKLNTKLAIITPNESINPTPTTTAVPAQIGVDGGQDERSVNADATILPDVLNDSQKSVMAEEDFELVDDPNDPDDGSYEDKNRKVMRSLQRGDQVQHVFNISRIIGLEGCEGLLILGKDSLYLVDNVFQRLDGEIVDVSQAPMEDRDPYLQMIAGKKVADKRTLSSRAEQESRSWKWSEVISISKRRFLFRDVAVEVFFTDGRSYLLTAISPTLRDDLYGKLTSKAPHTIGASSLPNPEDDWRLEALKVVEEAPTTFGSKFGSIFNSSAWNPAMRRWAKGEISNFHYLMLVNTMAGRTFNDLTQYPVFPWILSDYTSEELDLNNPSSFRDLSRPMGAQNNARQKEFIERYHTFAEMDQSTPPFHYGTHYSTSMIVTSYLIRLQPFVQSYLLLQGGSFDHPDRLFNSIEKAWTSASRDNTGDVRELIPEFFYLPEFLTNSNGYNFGLRQGNAGRIDSVTLPPWAKGDPKIFIAKHREALESPYVSRNLHQWIDLIFGSKQRGDAAFDSVNVFHPWSYHGAKDLDSIEDAHERLIAVGHIHNFGQTPHQIFSKPHQAREEVRHKVKRLDTSAESLTRLPFPLLKGTERIASLTYSPKMDRLLSVTAFRLNLPPLYDKYLEWGFSDNSIRFYFTETKKLAGLFENVHQGQLSCAKFASSQILITAGEDCVVSAHTIITSFSKPVDLHYRASLFGHKSPVTTLALSKSFSTILSAGSDGVVLLWDLNRFEFIRKLTHGRRVECAQINDVTGNIMLCRGQKVALYTLNGELLLDQNVCKDQDDHIHSCAFYEGIGNEWLERELVFTGHRRGVVNIWKKTVKGGRWILELVKKLDHVDQRRVQDASDNTEAAITCITPMPQIVYTGDEDGKVYEWDLVQRESK
ncbi:hypothetical protein B7494_g5457 [Chlorociboria aeruginascens]|nr:hypothetical protein B7494_g5457 [Chlorociboria aeruginascens]